VGKGRARFERELERLTEYKHRYVVCEGSWLALCAGQYRSRIPPASAMGTIAAWQVRYSVPFLFCEHSLAAEAMAVRLFTNVIKEEACLPVEPAPIASRRLEKRTEPRS
jgi:hypothetical protein